MFAVVGDFVYAHRAKLLNTAKALAEKGTLPQLEIAAGAAILGLIAIVFSLSIFSIQQVAQRGTAITLHEYAKDWVIRIVYWTLAFFALLVMLSALQRSELGLYRASFTLGMLAMSILMLWAYFKRVITFADPHFTIAKVAKRSRKLLRQIQNTERAFQAEVHYQRIRGRR